LAVKVEVKRNPRLPYSFHKSAAVFATLAWLVFSTTVASAPTIIRDVRVFDGHQFIEKVTVVLENDQIKQVWSDGQWSGQIDGGDVMDGDGYTLLPGLIDAHTHTFQCSSLERALDFGVTTSIDMGTVIPTMRMLQE